MFVYKGERWKLLDVVAAIVLICLFGYMCIIAIINDGFTIASIGLSIWATGTMLFILLYPFPIFGGSIEGEKLMEKAIKDNKPLSKEQMDIVMDRNNHSKIGPKTTKVFFMFIIISGSVALYGLYTNT